MIGCRKIEVDEIERSEDIKADTWMDVLTVIREERVVNFKARVKVEYWV